MAHHLYVTPGFVLDGRNSGEANKLLSIFTRDLGLVLTSVQGVRHVKSKLRPHIEPFSLGEFSLVRGKEIWRLTGARESDVSFYSTIKKNKKYLMLFARIFSLLKRLLHGEEVNSELFAVLSEASIFAPELMRVSATMSPEKEKNILEAFELVLVLRILSSLGYVSDRHSGYLFVRQQGFSITLLEEAFGVRRKLIEEINTALKASHL